VSAPARLDSDDYADRLHVAALEYAACGIAVFPARVQIVTKAGKRKKVVAPITNWDEASTTEPETISRWFGPGGGWRDTSLAIDTGKSGLVVIDPDGAEGKAAWRALVTEHKILETYRVATPGGGEHWYYRADPDRPVGCDNSRKIAPHVDVKGIGGFVFAPPSRDARGTYGWLEGAPEWDVLPLTPPLVVERMATRRQRTRTAGDGATATVQVPTISSTGFHPNYVAKAFRDEIEALAATTSGRNDALNRAAFALGRYVGAGVLTEAEVRSALEAATQRNGYAAMDGERERDSTLASGLASGIADPATPPPRLHPVPASRPGAAQRGTARDPESPGDPEDADGVPFEESERTTGWERTDLGPILDGTYQPPVPGVLHRSDGPGLFYPGLLHQVIGQPESGKSWLVLLAAAARLEAGEHVLFLDYESDPAQVVARLLAFGADRDALVRLFDYRRPEVGVDQAPGAFAELLTTRYALVVVDGVTDAIGLAGGSITDNDETADWIRCVPERIARFTGAAVVLVDHVAKGTHGAPSRYAVGAQQKLGKIRGVSYYVEPRVPVAPGEVGELAVTGTKDTQGQVKRHGVAQAGGRLWAAARVVIDATDPQHLAVRILPPFEAAGSGVDVGERGAAYERVPALMERVSRVLESAGEEISSTQAVKATKPFGGGRKEALLLALQALVREGYATRRTCGVAQLHGSVTPFREGTDPGVPAVVEALREVDPVIAALASEVDLP